MSTSIPPGRAGLPVALTPEPGSAPPGPFQPSTETAAAPLRPHPLLTEYYGDERQRRRQVDAWFDASARHYNFTTQAMSFGSGHRYREQALRRAGLGPGMRLLDVACGTGVIARHGLEVVGASGLAVGLDPSAGMLHEALARGVAERVQALAEALPFRPAQFDVVSMGFALRHVADLRRTFAEYRRVLKPAGKLLILEITPPRSRLSFHLLKFYLGRVVPLVARIGGGGRETQTLMHYYWDTIEHCVAPAVIMKALTEAGFAAVSRRVVLGIFSEYTAVS